MNLLQIHTIEQHGLVGTISNKFKKFWSLIGFEALVWILGIAYLLFIHIPGDTHFTICPLSNLGLKFCPGCGLGNSISYIFKGDLISSFYSHPLGIFALLVITFRIFTIIKNNRRRYA